jgi:hypothetical protein
VLLYGLILVCLLDDSCTSTCAAFDITFDSKLTVVVSACFVAPLALVQVFIVL